MFADTLETIVSGTDGGLAGLVMGTDGIAVDQFMPANGNADVESVGMEFSVIATSIAKAIELLDGGAVEDFVVRSERMVVLMRFVAEGYFAAILMAPSGNLGKARYLLRLHDDSFREALS